MINMHILVFGGCGFIGSHLVDKLVSLGHEVTVLDDFSNGRMSNLKEVKDKVTVVRGSITNKKTVEKVCRGVDLIYHEAALNLLRSVQSPVRDLSVNAVGTLNILEEMKDNPNVVMVFASTGSIYGEPEYNPQDEKHPCHPTSPYGISKLAAEQYVGWYAGEYGLKAVSLRYYNVVGSRQEYSDMGGVVPLFLKRMLQDKPLVIEGDGTQTRCFTYVDDVVRANVLASKTKRYGEAFNIGTSEITSINELADMICLMSNKPLKPVHVGPRVGDIHDFQPDIKKAEKLLGYKPEWKLADALPVIKEWMECELRL